MPVWEESQCRKTSGSLKWAFIWSVELPVEFSIWSNNVIWIWKRSKCSFSIKLTKCWKRIPKMTRASETRFTRFIDFYLTRPRQLSSVPPCPTRSWRCRRSSQPNKNFGKERWTDSGGNQTVFHRDRQRIMEVRHSLRPVRQLNNHSGGNFLQYEIESWVAVEKDDRE